MLAMHCASDSEHCVLQLAVLSTHVAPFSQSPALQFSFVVQLLPPNPTGHAMLVDVVDDVAGALVEDVVENVDVLVPVLDETPSVEEEIVVVVGASVVLVPVLVDVVVLSVVSQN